MEILDSGKIACQETMEKDSILLSSLKIPLLHLYDMGRSATYGYFTKPFDLLNLEAIEEEKISLAKRPTGGGIIFHFLDLAFSLLIPKDDPRLSINTLDNYKMVNSIVMQAIQPLLQKNHFSFISKEEGTKISHFCMAHPTPFDLLCNGKKIVGAAQRRTKTGLLHQGTIAILAPPLDLMQKILKNPQLASEIEKQSFYLTNNPLELDTLRKSVQSNLIHSFQKFFFH